jgi:hypothetical protein
VDFKAGSRFPAPGASHQLLCPVHDTVEKRWRHLDFFQYRTELVARVPRVETPEGKVVQIEVPWARPGSGFIRCREWAHGISTSPSSPRGRQSCPNAARQKWRPTGISSFREWLVISTVCRKASTSGGRT